MKAARLIKQGNDLTIADVEFSQPKGKQVLVKVRSAGVCHSDVHYKNGKWGEYTPESLGFSRPSLPLTLGHEIAGTIEEIGDDVMGLTPNQPVAVNPWEGEGQCYYCSIGEEQMCDNPQRLGINIDGGYAEYVLVPDSRYLKLIKHLSYDDAAVLTCSGVTTYRAIKEIGIAPDKKFLIVGSGGGLGTMALKIGKVLGIGELIGVDINDKAIEATKEAGADFGINAMSENVEKEVMDITDGHGVDGIIDLSSSQKTLDVYPKLLSKLGTYIMVGQFGAQLNMNAVTAVRKAIRFKGTYTGNHKDFVEVIDLAENKHIKPNVKYVGNLEKVNEALKNLEDLKVSGRQVVRP